jgi:hypothetical protein
MYPHYSKFVRTQEWKKVFLIIVFISLTFTDRSYTTKLNRPGFPQTNTQMTDYAC